MSHTTVYIGGSEIDKIHLRRPRISLRFPNTIAEDVPILSEDVPPGLFEDISWFSEGSPGLSEDVPD